MTGQSVEHPAGAQLIGVLVRSMPALACALRDVATADRYARLDAHERGVIINREVRCISRVIIDPRFRGLGLAVKLVRHALQHPEPGVLFTEALAAMGRVCPFFERAGMRRFDMPVEARAAHARTLDALETAGLTSHDLAAPHGARWSLLDQNRRHWLLAEIRRFLRATRRMSREQLNDMTEPDLLAAARERLFLQPLYFIYQHPRAEPTATTERSTTSPRSANAHASNPLPGAFFGS